MFFKKKNVLIQNDNNLEYFMLRDSLTGQRNMSFAIKEFERLKTKAGYGGVMVNLENADNLPLYKAEEYILETAQLIVSITGCEVSRLEYGRFVIFTNRCEELTKKLNWFLMDFIEKDKIYAVGFEFFDENEHSFDGFIKRLKRITGAMANVGYLKIAKDLPIK